MAQGWGPPPFLHLADSFKVRAIQIEVDIFAIDSADVSFDQ